MTGTPTYAELHAAALADIEHPPEWETAFHEAGHVVVEHVFGSTPDLVFMNDDKSAGELVAGQTRSRSFLIAEMFPYDGTERETRIIADAALTYAAVLFAGGIAARIATDRDTDLYERCAEVLYADEEDGNTDELKLAGLIAELDEGEGEMFLEAAAELALLALTEHWGQVTTVATALMTERSLDRDRLHDLLGYPCP